MGLYLGRLIIGRIFASEIWGAYFWEGLFFGGGGGERGLPSEFYGILNFTCGKMKHFHKQYAMYD